MPSPPTVLLVIDDEEIRSLFVAELASAGFGTVEISVREGFAATAHRTRPVAIAVKLGPFPSTVWMQVNDLRRLPATTATPIVILTDNRSDDCLRRAEDANCSAVLEIPLRPALLAETIIEICRH